MSKLENCPQCSTKLPPLFSTGRVVCGKCGWTNQPKGNSSPVLAKGEDITSKISTSNSTSSIHKFSANFQLYSAVISAVSLVGIFALMLFNLLLGHKNQWEYRTVEFLAETSTSAVTSDESNFSFKTIPDVTSQITEIRILSFC